MLQQKILGYMMYRFGFGRNSKLPFGQDVPVALVESLPGVGVKFNQLELDNMFFLHVETRSLGIKTD